MQGHTPTNYKDKKRGIDFFRVDVLVLAGGKGTRLRSNIGDVPKVLAPVAGRPFLDIIIEDLVTMGFGRIILSVGHLKNQIKDRYTGKGIFFVEEESPLGTGGAVKNAYALINSDSFLVMNGDSWFAGGIDMNAFYSFHKEKNALVSIVLARPRNEKDYGAVVLDRTGNILGFNEKEKKEENHFLNAGIYFMRRDVFSRMPHGSFSLEKDLFPKLIGSEFYGFPVDGELIDIGTPERYARAHKIFNSCKR